MWVVVAGVVVLGVVGFALVTKAADSGNQRRLAGIGGDVPTCAERELSRRRLSAYVYGGPWPGGPRYEVDRSGGIRIGDVVGVVAVVGGTVAGAVFGGGVGAGVGGALGGAVAGATAPGEVENALAARGHSTLSISANFAKDIANLAGHCIATSGRFIEPTVADRALLGRILPKVLENVEAAMAGIADLGTAGVTRGSGGARVQQKDRSTTGRSAGFSPGVFGAFDRS